MSKVYFTADTHFSHKNIIKYCNRGFANIDEMDATLIDNINKCVREEDILYHLGDFCFYPRGLFEATTRRFRNQIRCKQVHLILGNHDASIIKYPPDIFSSVSKEVIIEIEGYKLHLSHYPPKSLEHYTEGVMWLHGHCHRKGLDRPKVLDIGIDYNYCPLAFDEVIEISNRYKT